jgi:ketosteroid isomerase-like protein
VAPGLEFRRLTGELMKKILIVLATAWLAGCGDSDAGKPKDATAFFRPHIEKVYSAWSTLDASKPSMFYAKEPNLTFFGVSALKYKGWQEYEDGFRKTAAGWRSIQITVAPDLHASQLGDVAWVSYTLDYVLQPLSGDIVKAQARGTDVLEKRGEQWLIVHEHISAPMAQEQPNVKAQKAKATPHHKARKKRR